MAAQLLSTTAIVLDRGEAGERFIRLRALCRDNGVLTCMQRLSHKGAGRTAMLDLFDEAQLNLESSNQGRTWFVKDALPTRKRTALGARYEVLEQACRFTRILADNPVHEESREAVFSLLQRALDAWETGQRPEVVYLKSLYLFAQDEGYPVRENWRPGLNAADRATAADILGRPIQDQSRDSAEVRRITRALEEYLRHETPLHIAP